MKKIFFIYNLIMLVFFINCNSNAKKKIFNIVKEKKNTNLIEKLYLKDSDEYIEKEKLNFKVVDSGNALYYKTYLKSNNVLMIIMEKRVKNTFLIQNYYYNVDNKELIAGNILKYDFLATRAQIIDKYSLFMNSGRLSDRTIAYFNFEEKKVEKNYLLKTDIAPENDFIRDIKINRDKNHLLFLVKNKTNGKIPNYYFLYMDYNTKEIIKKVNIPLKIDKDFSIYLTDYYDKYFFIFSNYYIVRYNLENNKFDFDNNPDHIETTSKYLPDKYLIGLSDNGISVINWETKELKEIKYKNVFKDSRSLFEGENKRVLDYYIMDRERMDILFIIEEINYLNKKKTKREFIDHFYIVKDMKKLIEN